MKNLFLILFWIPSLLSTAQDWSPFVKGQKANYGIPQNSNSYVVDVFEWDSIVPRGNSELWIYNSSFNLDTCIQKGLDSYIIGNSVTTSIAIDSILNTPDSSSFYFDGGGISTFKPKTEIGDSWTISGINFTDLNITCIDKYDTVIFGTDDSVKVYQIESVIFDNKPFVLSKNHGFISFPDLFTYEHEVRELMGYQNDNLHVGYTQPEFKDYFHLNAGDILFWEDIQGFMS